MTMASMLLKSCAIPPVSCPSASIFCDCRSSSSALKRAILRFEFPCSLSNGLLEALRKCLHLRQRAFSLGNVDIHPDNPNGTALLVVKDDGPGFDRGDRLIAWTNDAELGTHCRRRRANTLSRMSLIRT